MEERRKATRFEPTADQDMSLQDAVDQGGGGAAPSDASSRSAPKPQIASDQEDDEGYTSRLLKAKNQAFRRKE